MQAQQVNIVSAANHRPPTIIVSSVIHDPESLELCCGNIHRESVENEQTDAHLPIRSTALAAVSESERSA